jgi:hypothetical protein
MKERTWRKSGSRRKSAAAYRKVSRRCKSGTGQGKIVRNKWTRAKAARGIQKGRTCHEGRKSVKDLGGGRPRYLRKRDLKKLRLERTGKLDTTFSKITILEIAKRCQIHCWDAEAQELDLVKGLIPSKMEKRNGG